MAGEFLAGLLSGLSESYREKASEEKRIRLLKEQLAMQNAQFEKQIALRKDEMAQRHGIEERQLKLQEMLGLRRADTDDKELAIREASLKSNADLQKELRQMEHGFKMEELATMGRQDLIQAYVASRLRRGEAEYGQRLNEQSAEADFGRKVNGAKVETDERIRLLKEQHAMQNAQFEKQIALRKEEMAQRQGIEERQLKLQEMLGLRRADTDDKELAIREASLKSNADLQKELRQMEHGFKMEEIATMGRQDLIQAYVASKLRRGEAEYGQQLNEKSAEADFGRKVRGAKVETDERIRLETTMREYDKRIKDGEKFDDLAREVMMKMAGTALEQHQDQYANFVTAKNNLVTLAAQAEAQKPGSGAGVIAMMDRFYGKDAEEGVKQGAIGPRAMQAFQMLLDPKFDSKSGVTAVLGALEGAQFNIPTNPSDAKKRIGPSDLAPRSTAATTGQASLSNEDLDGIINNNQWVKDTLDAELDLKSADVNLLTGQFGPARTMQQGKSVLRRWKLAELLGTAEGATLEERLKNAVTRLPSYRKVYSDYSIQPPAPARPGAGRK